MIKQISTYGAVLLTIMVIVRAGTIDDKVDLSDRYQRPADVAFVEDNLVLRYENRNYQVNTIDLIAFNAKPTIEYAAPKTNPRPVTPVYLNNLSADHLSEIDTPNENEIDTFDLEFLVEETELDETLDLSLDRESTINSGLSVIFNRERIHPKPTRIDLQE